MVDVGKTKLARTLKTHMKRVGCIINVSPAEVLTGSKDFSISLSDLRVKNSKVLTVLAHHYEVCGLSQQQNSIASSDSAGRLNIWDLRKSQPFSSRRLFSAAVKALDWCPWKHGLLALGGGSKDPRIVLWNAPDEETKQTINGKSQVTALRWREQERELVTAHGSGLGVVWDTEKCERKAELVGHRGRIVALAGTEEGIWTLGSDETLRGWKLKREKTEEKALEKEESLADFRLK